jgi:uncharacterized protein (DUF885 family)
MMSSLTARAPLAALFAAGLIGCQGPVEAEGSARPHEAAAAADTSDPAAAQALEREIERAASGVHDEALARLLRDHWRDRLERAPVFATTIGVHAFDARWHEVGPAARSRAREQREAFLERGQAIPAAELDEDDRLTLELFLAELESSAAREPCEFWAWSVSTRANPLSTIAELPELMASEEEHEALVARYRGFPALVDAQIADLRGGLARGLVADAESLRRTAEMLERQLATPVDEWSLLEPVAGLPRDDPKREALRAAVVEAVEPALRRFAALVRDELLPAGRGGAEVGLAALPAGATCYAALIRQHTSETPAAAQLHELGLEHIARIDQEFRELGARALGTGELDEVLARLRTDPALYFETAEEVEAFARESLSAAQAAVPKWFAHLPKTPCEVRRIPDYEAPFTTIAYYHPPADGEPGVYFINTHAPTTRPRYEARVLAIHEAVPGHHTQIALSQELPDAPAFRRYGGTTVFVEGWALYTERLADEMGLYETDLDRLGVLSFDAWRAARLVVDTGIHAKGWTREQAVEFMLAHTALAKNNIVNEVDRYVGWPGQALAYKYGQIEILRLRAEAEAALGERFDIAQFHEVVLGAGAVSLPILRRRIRAWVEQRSTSGG